MRRCGVFAGLSSGAVSVSIVGCDARSIAFTGSAADPDRAAA
jgi:hypothetical protein